MQRRFNMFKNWFSLSISILTVMCICAIFLPAQTGGIKANDPKAKESIEAALKALGGAEKISDIKSLILKGTITTITKSDVPQIKPGTTLREYEMRILLPDNYIIISRSSERAGYRGIVKGDYYSSQSNTTNINNEVLKWREIINWLHDLSGILLLPGPTPLELSSGSMPGVINMIVPAGKAAGMNGEIGEIEFAAKTGYPSVIRWNESTDFGNIPTTYTKEYSDRFSVNGIMFPRSINISNKANIFSAEIINEIRINEVLINPKLSLKDFENPK